MSFEPIVRHYYEMLAIGHHVQAVLRDRVVDRAL